MEPNIGLNCTCRSDCMQWCPRDFNCKSECCGRSVTASSESMETEAQHKIEQVAHEAIKTKKPKGKCCNIS